MEKIRIRDKHPGSATLGTSSSKIAKLELLVFLSAKWNHLQGTGLRSCDLLLANFTSLFFYTERNVTNTPAFLGPDRFSFKKYEFLNRKSVKICKANEGKKLLKPSNKKECKKFFKFSRSIISDDYAKDVDE
jgi:hypothetical protein